MLSPILFAIYVNDIICKLSECGRGVTLLAFITGSIARKARRRFLIYPEADFEVFRPARATHFTDGGEIWHGGGVRAKCHPIGTTTGV